MYLDSFVKGHSSHVTPLFLASRVLSVDPFVASPPELLSVASSNKVNVYVLRERIKSSRLRDYVIDTRCIQLQQEESSVNDLKVRFHSTTVSQSVSQINALE